jgi:hypothetical protein
MRTKIVIAALIAIILVTARISYVTLFPPAPPKAGTVGIVSKAKAQALSGSKFLNQLGKEGRLPGFSTNEHGMFASKVVEISYPYTLTVQFVKTGDKSRCNYYTIVQPTKDSEWQLKRAWQTDATGKIVEEWTVE